MSSKGRSASCRKVADSPTVPGNAPSASTFSVPASMTNGYTSLVVLIELITSKATTVVPYGFVGCWTKFPRCVT